MGHVPLLDELAKFRPSDAEALALYRSPAARGAPADDAGEEEEGREA